MSKQIISKTDFANATAITTALKAGNTALEKTTELELEVGGTDGMLFFKDTIEYSGSGVVQVSHSMHVDTSLRAVINVVGEVSSYAKKKLHILDATTGEIYYGGEYTTEDIDVTIGLSNKDVVATIFASGVTTETALIATSKFYSSNFSGNGLKQRLDEVEEGLTGKMATTPSGDPMHYMYILAGNNFITYDATTGLWSYLGETWTTQ